MDIPAHTYSIIAFDPAAEQFGAAVQSRYFKVGPIVPWIEAGTGVVATQSFVEVSYGPLGLQEMRSGKTAAEALENLLATDPRREIRQVAMLDRRGQAAVHTGSQCIQAAGHRVGAHYSVQANLMETSQVWHAMAEAYESTEGELAERMMAALEAAQAAGGDIRGQQSAALVVSSSNPQATPEWVLPCDLRVDDHPQPVEELRRLLSISQAQARLKQAALLLEGSPADFQNGLDAFESALGHFPQGFNHTEEIFWFGRQLAELGKLDLAAQYLLQAIERDDRWREILDRLAAVGRLPHTTQLLERISK
jgi:uncharacterized Ntn-hydrolase superfamily protein